MSLVILLSNVASASLPTGTPPPVAAAVAAAAPHNQLLEVQWPLLLYLATTLSPAASPTTAVFSATAVLPTANHSSSSGHRIPSKLRSHFQWPLHFQRSLIIPPAITASSGHAEQTLINRPLLLQQPLDLVAAILPVAPGHPAVFGQGMAAGHPPAAATLPAVFPLPLAAAAPAANRPLNSQFSSLHWSILHHWTLLLHWPTWQFLKFQRLSLLPPATIVPPGKRPLYSQQPFRLQRTRDLKRWRCTSSN